MRFVRRSVSMDQRVRLAFWFVRSLDYFSKCYVCRSQPPHCATRLSLWLWVGRQTCRTLVSTGPIMHQSTAQHTPTPNAQSVPTALLLLASKASVAAKGTILFSGVRTTNQMKYVVWTGKAPYNTLYLGLLGSHPWAPATKRGIRDSIHWRCGLSFSWTTTAFRRNTPTLWSMNFTQKILDDTTSTLPANTLPITKTDRRKPVQWTSVSRNSVISNNNNLQNNVSSCIMQHNTIGMSELAHSSYYTGFGEIYYLWRHQLSNFSQSRCKQATVSITFRTKSSPVVVSFKLQKPVSS